MKEYLISLIIGTRPEAIKLAPVINAFKQHKSIKTRVILTGQHKEMVEQVLKIFNFSPNKDLNIMKEKQSLSYVTSKSLNGLDKEFENNRPRLVLVQGDTTSAFSGALAAFYKKIPVAHVEAGLRTSCIYDPYPEEINRRLISQIADIHFAPTIKAKENLIASNVQGEILVTGNTVIDALLSINTKEKIFKLGKIKDSNYKIILATIHRRENWGENLAKIAKGLKLIIDNNPESYLILPMHANKVVREMLLKILDKHPRILLREPMNYEEMVSAIKNCKLILTDSGGIQEEAPSFGKPVLVLRNTTERQEAIDYGTAKLVGHEPHDIFKEAHLLLNDHERYKKMSSIKNPYGDGSASRKILKACMNFLEK